MLVWNWKMTLSCKWYKWIVISRLKLHKWMNFCRMYMRRKHGRTLEAWVKLSWQITDSFGSVKNAISVQFSRSVWLFVNPWIAAHQASLSITNSRSLLKLMSIEAVMPSNHLILCHPLILPLSSFPSIRVFSNESVLLIRWAKYWSFSFSISPSNEYSALISFRMDWLDLFAVQGTLKSLPQHHSSKASILQCSAFLMVQLSHPSHDYCKNHSFD